MFSAAALAGSHSTVSQSASCSVPARQFTSFVHVGVCHFADLPDLRALLLRTHVSWAQIHIIVVVREEEALCRRADVGRIAVELHCTTAAFALDPGCSRPLADTPGGLRCRATHLGAPSTAIVATRVAPRALAGELPEGGLRVANLRTDSMGRVVVALAIATRVAMADGLRLLRNLVLGTGDGGEGIRDEKQQEGGVGHLSGATAGCRLARRKAVMRQPVHG